MASVGHVDRAGDVAAAVADEDADSHGGTSASVPGEAPAPRAVGGRRGFGRPGRLRGGVAARSGRLGGLGGPRRFLGRLLGSLALFFSPDDRRVGDGLLHQRLRVDDVLVQHDVLGAQAEGEADDLRQIQDGHLVAGAQVAVDLRLFQVEVDVAERAADHDGVGPGLQGLLDDLAAQHSLDLFLGQAHAGAATLGLVVPPLDVGARGLQQQVHHHGLLDVGLAGQLARSPKQTSVVGHDFELREIGLDERSDLRLAHELHQVLGQGVDLHPSRVGLVEHGVDLRAEGVALVDLELRVLLPLEARRAGSEQLVAHLGRLAQVARGQGLGKQMVHHVRGSGAAAGPVGHLFVGHAQHFEHLAGGVVELLGGVAQRAPGIVGQGHPSTSLPAASRAAASLSAS